jgi:hypothetical protein
VREGCHAKKVEREKIKKASMSFKTSDEDIDALM